MVRSKSRPTGVLLIGSIPLETTTEVFTTLASSLPNRLISIPDGETGIRDLFILWQGDCFPVETMHSYFGGTTPQPDTNVPLSNYDLSAIAPTKYDDYAIASYAKFVELRNKGVIPPGVRFQVSIPTPMNAVTGFVRPEYQPILEPLYEYRILEALTRIVRKIPAADLAIQWDMAYDVFALEHELGKFPDERFKAHFSPNVKQGILDRVQRLCAFIPKEVMLGFHFCYGDYEHKHFLEPTDLGVVVDLANDVIDTLVSKGIHAVDWIHMPVPKSRTDAAYFEPLRDLNLAGAYLYLGVVHAGDEEGTRERIAVASGLVEGEFGVATECGMGRTERGELGDILEISRCVTGEWERVEELVVVAKL